MNILLTGSAGFIGFHTAKALLERGDNVIGFDNFNDYYDPELKEARNKILEQYPNFTVVRGDLKNKDEVNAVIKTLDTSQENRVCHLAAVAGVRYSIEKPMEYVTTNIVGFQHVIDACKEHNVGGLIYASSSSVYGHSGIYPSLETQTTDVPSSLYAASKKSNELVAHSYNHLFGLCTTGLRFFTVYGPYGRPDMALFIFTDKIAKGEPLPVFGEGKMQRDFTYVDDIVSGVIASIDKNYDCEIFNLAGGRTEELMAYINAIEETLNKKANINLMPMQPGDIKRSEASIQHAKTKLGYDPKTPISVGVPKFVEWYKEYYKI
jgi:UDP-glucuronate 4-epimerase